MKNIGFFGLGNMGSRMVKNLLNANYNVYGFDVEESLIDTLLETGLKKSESPKRIFESSDLIITMLPDGMAVEKVFEDNINNLKPNTIFIDCSTIDVNSAVKLNVKSKNNNVHFLDAPVSGGTIGAENASLTFMVGGDKNAYNKILPILNVMGSKVVYCGNTGSGQATKLCNNMLLAITMIGVSEALNLAKNLNLNLNTLFDVLSTATGSCWALNNYCPVPNVGPKSPADNGFLPGFSAKLMSKDLKLAINAAKNSGSIVKFGEQAEQLYLKMSQGDNGNRDFSYIIEEINKIS